MPRNVRSAARLCQANAPAGLCPNCLMALNLKTETVFTDERPPRNRRCRPNKSPRIFRSLKSSNVSDAAAWAWFTRRGRRTLNRFVALKLLAPERVRDAEVRRTLRARGAGAGAR